MSTTTAVATTDIVIRLVGESGEGTVSLGELTAQMLTAMGLEIYTFQTFPAEIKGGTVMYQIRARSGHVYSHGDSADVVVALNDEGFDLFGDVLREDGILLYDSDVFTPRPEPGRIDYALPVSTLAKAEKEAVRHDVEGEALKRLPPPKNIVGLGALLRLIDAPLEPAEEYVRNLFGRKGEAIVRMNLSALHTGVQKVEEQIKGRRTPHIEPIEREKPVIRINGNQMLALGAIAGGLQFYGGYPITPATEIMEYLAKELPKFGGNVVQAEDEIAALGMCLGATYAGKKSMTATSGPGLSLMVEQINLAGQAELPVVIVDVQRGGASTGMPTKTSQGDLNLAVFGVHNESPRIVVSPAGVVDAFWTTVEAFNLAEEFQCPVIILSEQMLASRVRTELPPDPARLEIVDRLQPKPGDLVEGFDRYLDTPSGISAMAVPGTPGGIYTATGIEHDEHGNPGYTPELAAKMKSKRFRKMDTCLEKYADRFARFWGDAGSVDVGIIAFGATEGSIKEATQRAQADGYKVAHLHLRMLNPLPVKIIEDFARTCRQILVPELNYTGQFAKWIRANTGLKLEEYHKDEGVPFSVNELYNEIVRLALREESK